MNGSWGYQSGHGDDMYTTGFSTAEEAIAEAIQYRDETIEIAWCEFLPLAFYVSMECILPEYQEGRSTFAQFVTQFWYACNEELEFEDRTDLAEESSPDPQLEAELRRDMTDEELNDALRRWAERKDLQSCVSVLETSHEKSYYLCDAILLTRKNKRCYCAHQLTMKLYRQGYEDSYCIETQDHVIWEDPAMVDMGPLPS